MLPIQLLESLKGSQGFDRKAFENVHASGEQITSIRLNPLKSLEPEAFYQELSNVPWADYGFYLSERPSFTFDPLFHAGTYYVQEASSMFLEQAMKQSVDLSKPIKVLDLCASPGGKSTHIQSLISKDSLLVSNDVIRSRANILKDNIIKWGSENVIVTNNDPRDFAILEDYFDVIVVDAPCSGSGLFRRDPEAIGEWSENNVQLCSQRQQRILADVWPSLKKDGILIYSTCSYSKEEDEDIMDWITNELDTANYQLKFEEYWGIEESISDNGYYGYRFWPDKVKGEGFFITCFQKKDGEEDSSFRIKNKPEQATKSDLTLIEEWIKTKGRSFVKHKNTVYAWPENLFVDFNLLLEKLRVIYSGVLVGELMRNKLVPHHSLSMSKIMVDSVNTTELDNERAIQYLQRKELNIETNHKGWQLITYKGHPLGWINSLTNRINNYYPKELRILKDNLDA